MEMRELLEEFLQLRNGMKVSDVIKELTSSAVYFSRRPPKTEDGSDILKLLKKYEYTG